MKPHPDFEARMVPEAFALGDYQLEMLTGADLEEDYAAVTRSQSVLQGLFDPIWPQGLTLEENLTDLHWHHREFTAKRSFAWVVRDRAGLYLGCAYLFPDIGGRRTAEGTYWMAASVDRLSHLARFGPLYETWVQALLPAPFEVRFNSNASL